MNKDYSWIDCLNYIDSLLKDELITLVQKETIISLWTKISDKYKNILVPGFQYWEDDNKVFICWAPKGRQFYFDFEVDPDGKFDWFFKNQKTQEYEGSNDPIDSLPQNALDNLKHFMKE